MEKIIPLIEIIHIGCSCLGRLASPFLLRSSNGLTFTSRNFTALIKKAMVYTTTEVNYIAGQLTQLQQVAEINDGDAVLNGINQLIAERTGA